MKRQQMTGRSVRVHIDQLEKRKQLEQSLNAWLKSAVPMLFFRSIKKLEIQGKGISKEDLGPGPVT